MTFGKASPPPAVRSWTSRAPTQPRLPGGRGGPSLDLRRALGAGVCAASALLATIEVPEKVANVCFGGPDGRDLYVVASTSLYRVGTRTVDAVHAREVAEGS